MTWLTRRRLGTLLTVAFVIGATEFLPAHLFEARINRALPAPWHAVVSGTIWDGFGVLQAGQSSDAFTVPLTWKFDPLALARLRLAWTVVPTGSSLSGSIKVAAGWQSVELSEAMLTLDADTLQHAIPVVTLFAPSGTLLVSTPGDARLTVGYGSDFHATGDAHIQADNLRLGRFSPQPLGSYQLKFTARGPLIDYLISQSSGALTLDGGGSIQTASPRQIAYSGHMTLSPTLPDGLLSQLKTVGQPAADGRLRVDWKAGW
jgi:hypothetical protein